jgi:hypothetical protein
LRLRPDEVVLGPTRDETLSIPVPQKEFSVDLKEDQL